MSYCIEYARQFLKSEEGITPCWLHGDNNVGEIVWRNGRNIERRARDWSVFQNMVGTTVDALLKEVEGWMGGAYQEHWMRNGKWVDDEGLRRWIVSGCRKAATVEEVLAANPVIRSLHCYCAVWHEMDSAVETEAYVKTTEELDQWIRAIRAHKDPSGRQECFPVVDFCVDKLNSPASKQRETPAFCLIKSGHNYLVDIVPGKSTRWSPNKTDARVFTAEEAESILYGQASLRLLRNAHIINAHERLTQPFNAVLRVGSAGQSPRYISGRGRNRIYLCNTVKGALRYANAAVAEKAAKELRPKHPGLGEIAVEVIE